MKRLTLFLTLLLILQKSIGQVDIKILGINDSLGNYATINSEKIYYEVYGKGFPLILLHGGLGSISEFKNNISDLADQFQVIAVDSRGYGRSSNVTDTISYSIMADDVYQLIKYLKLDSVNIVGFSDGGIIGLHLASKYPEYVNKVVASGANLYISGLTSTNFYDNFMTPEKVQKEAFWNKFRDAYKTNPYPETFDHHIQLIREMWRTEPYLSKQEYEKITRPVLLVFGDRDVVKIEHISEMYSLLPKETRQLCIFPKTSHFTFDEKPKEINKIIIDFLKENKK